jgi:DNA-binding response OmpR family regulator
MPISSFNQGERGNGGPTTNSRADIRGGGTHIEGQTRVRRVLVVEDEPDIQNMVAQHLTGEGFDVCLASNGEMALQIAREKLPSVVCLDLNLPRISGYDVCEQIRTDPALNGISILMTSARSSLDIRVFSLEAGADAYLTKPYGLEQLRAEIELLFEARERSFVEGEALAVCKAL